MRTLQMFLPLFLLIQISLNFNFREVVVTATSYVIRNTASYNFTLSRNVDNNYAQTSWNSVSVNASSNITIQFPAEYANANIAQCSCISITIDSNTITNPTLVVEGNTVIIQNTITVPSFIQIVKITLSNILNPVPASKTSFFVGTIGDDVGQPFSNAFVQLQMGSLASCSATFSKGLVNTYDNLTISLSSLSLMATTNLVYVTFPSSYQSSYTSKAIGVVSTMTCSAQNNNGIYCKGNVPSANMVTVYSPFSSNASYSTTFQINSILVPPTVQQIDTITIGTYTSGLVGYDRCTVSYSNLNALSMNSLTYTTTQVAYVNTAIPLTLSVPLLTNLYNLDFILINMASTYSPIYSLLSLTGSATTTQGTDTINFVINSNTAVTLNISTTSNITSGTTLSIIISNIIASPSSGISPVFTVGLYQALYLKSSGSVTMAVYPNAITSILTTAANPIVGALSTYSIKYISTDPIPTTGMIRLIFPSIIAVNSTITQVTINSHTVAFSLLSSLNGISLTNLPTITQNSSNIIVITNIRNPFTTDPIDSMQTLSTYYSTSTADLVDTVSYLPSELTFTGPQTITYLVYSSSNVVAATNVSLLFVVTTQIGMSNGGSIEIILNQMPFSTTSTSCQFASIAFNYTYPCYITSNNSINKVVINNITSNLGLSFNITVAQAFTNPSSTMPQSYFTIITFSALGTQTERSSTLSQSYLTISTPAPAISFTITRSSTVNSEKATYTFTFSQPSNFLTSSSDINQLSLTFPPEMNLSFASCAICTVSNSTILASFDNSVLVNTSLVTFSINNIINSPSFQPPSQNISATTLLNTYFSYSRALKPDNYLQTINSVPSNILLANDTVYSSFTIGSQNTLTVDVICNNSLVYYYSLIISPQIASSNITCTTSAFYLCTYNATSNIITIKKSNSSVSTSNVTFVVSGFINPLISPGQYLSAYIQGYSQNSYLVNEYNGTLLNWSPNCNFPCQTCSASNKSACLSCFSSTSISNYIYYYAAQKICLSICYSTQLESGNQCLDCTNNCMQCSGATSRCTACNTSTSYAYYFNYTCLPASSCPLYYYADSTYNCLPCQFPCLACNNYSQCISCATGAFWYSGNCVSTCPFSYTIANSINKTCDLCSSICATCSETANNCTTCGAGTIKFNGSCYTNCSGSTYIYIDHCVTNCVSPCLTCQVAATYCISCLQNTSQQLYLYQGQCLTSCPSSFVINSTTNNCDSCSSLNLNCSYCSFNQNCTNFGGSLSCSISQYYTCLKCDSSYTYYFNSQLGVYQCVTALPDGYTSINSIAQLCDPVCLTCSNFTTNCIYCSSLHLFNGQCTPSCLDGFYSKTITVTFNSVNTSTLICTPCQGYCLTCLNSIQCLSCKSSTYYSSNFTCVFASSCPANTYGNDTYGNCTACSPPCSTCYSYSGCYSCANPTYFYEGSCLTACPLGYYAVNLNNSCTACTSPCLTCEMSENICTGCIISYFYYSYNNSCLQTCPLGFTVNYNLQICQNCTLPCLECSDSLCFKCTAVNNITYYIFQSTCISTCPDGYYAVSDPLNSTCALCNSSCSSCLNSLSCISCAIGYSLLSPGLCVAQCPTYQPVKKTISGVSTCLNCSDLNCQLCTNTDFCLFCVNFTFVLQQGACSTICPEGQILTPNITNNTASCQNMTYLPPQPPFIEGSTMQLPINFPCCYLAAFFCTLSLLIKFIQSCCVGNDQVLIFPLLSSALALPQVAATYFGSFTYFLLRYRIFLRGPLSWDVFIYIFAICIVLQLVTGLYTLIVQTKIQWNDSVYNKWTKHSNCMQKVYQYIINLLTLLNFKISHCLWCGIKSLPMLQTSNKLVFYNRPSAVSALISLALTTDCILIIVFHPELSLVYFDIIIVLVLSLLFSLLALRRPYDFFIRHLEINPNLPLNKRVAESQGYLISPMRPLKSYDSNKISILKGKSQLLNESISQRSSESSFNPLSSQRSSVHLENISIQYSNPGSSQKFTSRFYNDDSSSELRTLGTASVHANPGGVSTFQNMKILNKQNQLSNNDEESQQSEEQDSQITDNLLETNVAVIENGDDQSFSGQNDESVLGREFLPKELRNNYFDLQRCHTFNQSIGQSEEYVYFSQHPSIERSISHSEESPYPTTHQIQSKQMESYFKPQQVVQDQSIIGNVLPASIANLSIESNLTEFNKSEQNIPQNKSHCESNQSKVSKSLQRSIKVQSSVNNDASINSKSNKKNIAQSHRTDRNLSRNAEANNTSQEEDLQSLPAALQKGENSSYLAQINSSICDFSKKQFNLVQNSNVSRVPHRNISQKSEVLQSLIIKRHLNQSEVVEKSNSEPSSQQYFNSFGSMENSLLNSRTQNQNKLENIQKQENKALQQSQENDINVSKDLSIENINGSFVSQESLQQEIQDEVEVNHPSVLSISSFYQAKSRNSSNFTVKNSTPQEIRAHPNVLQDKLVVPKKLQQKNKTKSYVAAMKNDMSMDVNFQNESRSIQSQKHQQLQSSISKYSMQEDEGNNSILPIQKHKKGEDQQSKFEFKIRVKQKKNSSSSMKPNFDNKSSRESVEEMIKKIKNSQNNSIISIIPSKTSEAQPITHEERKIVNNLPMFKANRLRTSVQGNADKDRQDQISNQYSKKKDSYKSSYISQNSLNQQVQKMVKIQKFTEKKGAIHLKRNKQQSEAVHYEKSSLKSQDINSQIEIESMKNASLIAYVEMDQSNNTQSIIDQNTSNIHNSQSIHNSKSIYNSQGIHNSKNIRKSKISIQKDPSIYKKSLSPSLLVDNQFDEDGQSSHISHRSNIFNQSHLSNNISINNNSNNPSLSSLSNSRNQSQKMRTSSRFKEGKQHVQDGYNEDIISQEAQSIDLSDQNQHQPQQELSISQEPLPSKNVEETQEIQFRIRTTKKKKRRQTKSKEKILYAEEKKFRSLKRQAKQLERQTRINQKLQKDIELEHNNSLNHSNVARLNIQKSGSRERKRESPGRIQQIYKQRPYNSREKQRQK